MPRESVRFFPRWNPQSGSQVAGLLRMACDIHEMNPAAGEWIEVGTHLGEAALLFSSLPWVRRLRTVDNTLGDCIEEVSARLKGRAEIIRISSLAFAATLSPQSVDVVYIDADHSYPCVSADIRAYAPAIRGGGFLCGHDFCDNHPGVLRAVQEFLTAAPGSGVKVYEDRSWLIRIDSPIASDQQRA